MYRAIPDPNPGWGGGGGGGWRRQYFKKKHICDYFLQQEKLKLKTFKIIISGGASPPPPQVGYGPDVLIVVVFNVHQTVRVYARILTGFRSLPSLKEDMTSFITLYDVKTRSSGPYCTC